jgi:energy-converting hydrogenase A subunit R
VNFICFDLEGPLSPQDNAYELMKHFPEGGRIFEVISRYDDLLALEGKEGYEPGDTLALIVPFLLYHGLSESDIAMLAARATLVPGAPDLVAQLKGWGWEVFCITTTYEQYARRICQRVGISPHHIACTAFPLDRYRSGRGSADWASVGRVEKDILALKLEDDAAIKARLDRFFWVELAGTELGIALAEVRPVGGRRKAEALERFAQTYGLPLSEAVVVGDSITDAEMFKAVNKAGGLAIAFNANQYALPYATIGLASTHLSDLADALEAWQKGRLPAVEALVRAREKVGGKGDRGHFHWLLGRKDMDQPLAVHRRIRRLVREEAGKLG